ncbi:MAG: PilZ domain-containing protein [Deltaproteobacteria bacterium]|nr:PilZ domain-containing protein [Deltaproteobacteria bacterium]
MTEKKTLRDKFIICYDDTKGTARVDVEKRILKRLPVDQSIFIGLSDKTLKEGRMLNISLGGALIEVHLDLKANQIIEIRMREDTPPFCRAVVVRIAQQGFSYGVKWIEFIEDHLPKGILIKETL